MKYVDLLKEQIESYLANLDRHDSTISEAVQILEEKAVAAKEKYEADCHKTEEALQSAKVKKERVTAIRKSVEELSAQLRQKIVEYTNYTAEAQKNPNDGAELRDKAAACDREIQEKYAELLTLRKKYAENYASIADNPSEVENLLEKERKKAAKQDKEQRDDISVLKLVPPMKMHEQIMMQPYLDLLPLVALDSRVLKKEDYSELLLLAALCTRRAEIAHCVPALGGSVSVVCEEKCKKICDDLTYMQDKLQNFWTVHAYQEKKPKNFVFDFSNGDVCPQASSENSHGSESYLLFSRDFLDKITVALQENPNHDLFTLCDRLIEIGKKEANSASEEICSDRNAERNFQNDLKEFKRLYEETPEERLVTEQRYYQQKILEEAQEKNRLLEQQMREERIRRREEQREAERRYREEQEEQARRERELERERDRERRREEERERSRQQEQKRAEDARRREEADRRRREESETRHQCNTCANAGHCSSYMRRPNCAAYRPR